MSVNNIPLAIGQRWKTRDGQEVNITKKSGWKEYPWVAKGATGTYTVTDQGIQVKFETNETDLITLIQDEHGFIPWNGGECPVGEDVKIKYKMRNEPKKTHEGFPDCLHWDHSGLGGDIIAYRVVQQEVKPTKVDVEEEQKYTVEQVFKAINEATEDSVAYTNTNKVKSHLAKTHDPDYKLYLELKAKFG